MEKQPRLIRLLAAPLLALLLVGCGADGEPEPPAPRSANAQPTMNAHVGISPNGNAHVGGGVGLRQGPISLYLGF